MKKVKDKADGGRVCGYEGVGLEGASASLCCD